MCLSLNLQVFSPFLPSIHSASQPLLFDHSLESADCVFHGEVAYLSSMDITASSFNKADCEFYADYAPAGQEGLLVHVDPIEPDLFHSLPPIGTNPLHFVL